MFSKEVVMLYRYLKKMSLILLLSLMIPGMALANTGESKKKGIYLTQSTATNTKLVDYLIKNSKSVGINTFVIDMTAPSKAYQNNIQKIKNAGIRYVARVGIFPDGGTASQVKSLSYWQKRSRN